MGRQWAQRLEDRMAQHTVKKKEEGMKERKDEGLKGWLCRTQIALDGALAPPHMTALCPHTAADLFSTPWSHCVDEISAI